MSIFGQQALIQWFVFFGCVILGYLLTRPFEPPESPLVWIVMAAIVFVLGFLPILAKPVVILRTPMPLNMIFWGLGVGVLIGFLVRRSQPKD